MTHFIHGNVPSDNNNGRHTLPSSRHVTQHTQESHTSVMTCESRNSVKFIPSGSDMLSVTAAVDLHQSVHLAPNTGAARTTFKCEVKKNLVHIQPLYRFFATSG